MSAQNVSKLKHLIDRVPNGFYVDAKWLAQNDISRSSVYDYQQAGWLEREGHGIYRRPIDGSDQAKERAWEAAILSAQRIMDYDFHIGGMAALKLQGRGHYLELGREVHLDLYGDVPRWLPKLSLNTEVRAHRRQLFGSNPIGVENLDFDRQSTDQHNPWKWPMRRSSAERAIFEALNELPDASFHQVDMVFQGLSTLRPMRLDSLLQACKSVKTKRLFFLFADRHHHAWLRHVDRAAVDFGRGPRSLVPGGTYVPEYELVVPDEFAGERRSE